MAMDFYHREVENDYQFQIGTANALMIRNLALAILILLSTAAVAQTPNPVTAPEARPIQDNSFLLEEAYNQEAGVIQHISFFSRRSNDRSWVYTFTQEWPVNGQKNQFSYTLGAAHSGDFAGSGTGVGDTALNYRYQLVGSGETRLAIAPRVSLLIPSGDPKFGRGFGGTGLQTNTAISYVWNRYLVSHTNFGATWVPHATDDLGNRAGTVGYNLGQSFIWLANPRFNVMLETVYNDNEGIAGPAKTQRSKDLLISPGVRWAYNFKNGLQIVPGVAVPLGVGPSSGDKGVILYLSFEHPWPWLVKKQTH
jgi:hypothetical protein